MDGYKIFDPGIIWNDTDELLFNILKMERFCIPKVIGAARGLFTACEYYQQARCKVMIDWCW